MPCRRADWGTEEPDPSRGAHETHTQAVKEPDGRGASGGSSGIHAAGWPLKAQTTQWFETPPGRSRQRGGRRPGPLCCPCTSSIAQSRPSPRPGTWPRTPCPAVCPPHPAPGRRGTSRSRPGPGPRPSFGTCPPSGPGSPRRCSRWENEASVYRALRPGGACACLPPGPRPRARAANSGRGPNLATPLLVQRHSPGSTPTPPHTRGLWRLPHTRRADRRDRGREAHEAMTVPPGPPGACGPGQDEALRPGGPRGSSTKRAREQGRR